MTDASRRPPVPPFTEPTARQKVQAAEDAWNSRDPDRVALAYTEDSEWRNRDEFFQGREAIRAFLTRKWARELHYVLRRSCGASPRTASMPASTTTASPKVTAESSDAIPQPRGRTPQPDALEVAKSHRSVNRGASVGSATRRNGETPATHSNATCFVLDGSPTFRLAEVGIRYTDAGPGTAASIANAHVRW